MLKNLLQMHFRLLQSMKFPKQLKVTCDLIGNKIKLNSKISKIRKTSSLNSSEAVTNEAKNTEHDKKMQ